MRALFPIALNLLFSLCLLGIILIPISLDLPFKLLMYFYIIAIFVIILAFGLAYTIIDIRDILLDIDKNIKKYVNPSSNLSENVIADSKDGDPTQNLSDNTIADNVDNNNEKSESNSDENRLICPYCGADYSEYPKATACFNCHQYFTKS